MDLHSIVFWTTVGGAMLNVVTFLAGSTQLAESAPRFSALCRFLSHFLPDVLPAFKELPHIVNGTVPKS